MKLKMKLCSDGTTLIAALLLTLSVHGTTSYCTTTSNVNTCVQTMTCDELDRTFNQNYCRHNRYGTPEYYENNLIFKDIPTRVATTVFETWENQFYNYLQNRQLKLLSLQSNSLIITPIIRRYTLNIKHIDFSHNSITEFDMTSLYNVNNLEIFDISYNYISDLQGATNTNSMAILSVLNLSHNQIENIEKSLFKGFTGLRSLDLSHNNISYVSFKSFMGLSSLTNLKLSFNSLKEFNMALFELSDLQYLDVSFNQLTTLYKQDLMKAVYLKQLNIQNNNLKSLDPEMFSSLISLEQLNMSNNGFGDSLDESCFKNNVNLVSVDLSYNGLSSLVRNAFSSRSLETFDVTGNVLSGILVPEYFNGMRLVTVLDLSNQYLTGVSNNTFSGMESLEILNLSRNKISVIEYEAFVNLFNLSSLDLSHNGIKDIDFGHSGLNSLSSLRVNHNLIGSIDNNTFENLNALEILDLSCNYIEHLCSRCLPLGSLIYLYLENNTFAQIDSGSFASLSHVTELDFSNFRLSKLFNNTFDGLDSVTELNISNNRIEVVEDSAFRGLLNLTTLDMSNNYLDTFTIGPDLSNLLTLNLQNNRLSTIVSLSGLYNLEFLCLSHNKLKLPGDSFDLLLSLRELKLSNNSLSQFVVPSLEALSRLDLGNNHIHSIEYSSNRITDLREIKLNSNKIQDVKLLNLSRNSFIEELHLSENLIEYIDVLSLGGIRHLRILDLSKNFIPDLAPGLFVELQHLEIFNISHNRIKEIKFGVFNGLDDLRILDMSHNLLYQVHVDLFLPLTLISSIMLDNNKINTVDDMTTFVRPSTTVSLGGNPLDCRWLSSMIRFISSTNSFIIKAQYNNFTGENFNGITCVRQDAHTNNVLINSKDEENNYTIQHDLRPHLSNLTQSLRNILDKKISFPSSPPENYLEPFLLNVTNMLEKILNKNYSLTIDKENDVDLYTNKHYYQIETYMKEILDQMKQRNSAKSISISEILSSMNKSKEVSAELKGNDVESEPIKELNFEILQLKKDLVNSMISRDQKFDSFVANVTRYLDRNKLQTMEEPLPQTASDELSPTNYGSRIKLTEAFVVIILIILLSFITYKIYLSKVLSKNRQLQVQSFQNIPMD